MDTLKETLETVNGKEQHGSSQQISPQEERTFEFWLSPSQFGMIGNPQAVITMLKRFKRGIFWTLGLTTGGGLVAILVKVLQQLQ